MTSRPTWRLLDSGASDGYTNMAIVEAMLLAVQAGIVPPTLRLYAWQPACLSIGAFQSVAGDIDSAACAAHGIDWVRRLTGGRAILHDQEVTYSVAALQNDERVTGDVMESYRRISRGLLEGMRLLGVDAVLAPSAIPATPAGVAKPAACFAAPSQHEIMVGGRKLIGSAQRRQGTALLQHGSILLNLDVVTLMSLLCFPSEQERATMTARVRDESVTLDALLGRKLTYRDVTPLLAQGYAAALDIDLMPGSLTPWEQETAARLRRDKYTADEWRFRK
jgi:lipoate-protein ligase A